MVTGAGFGQTSSSLMAGYPDRGMSETRGTFAAVETFVMLGSFQQACGGNLLKFLAVFPLCLSLVGCVVEPGYGGGDAYYSPGYYSPGYYQPSYGYYGGYYGPAAPSFGVYSYSYGGYRYADHDNHWNHDNHWDDGHHGNNDNHWDHGNNDHWQQSNHGWNGGNSWQQHRGQGQNGNGWQNGTSRRSTQQNSRPWGSK